ncbi:hypothetical protein RSOLAG1IB_09505 [Rhizoctonia solani AG-1 IB]|uniref:Uncharacterized protein n=1 Tax=Thanatephorus cucumeris (strain AG1-IB / isolate 7/3/14) TaxID=1108050 RepID=A0A0B7FQK1_THACB|nr:hypothetical protein RSOLAG1IB_09505 [Rhizoctonia solani AG-1 IB]
MWGLMLKPILQKCRSEIPLPCAEPKDEVQAVMDNFEYKWVLNSFGAYFQASFQNAVVLVTSHWTCIYSFSFIRMPLLTLLSVQYDT